MNGHCSCLFEVLCLSQGYWSSEAYVYSLYICSHQNLLEYLVVSCCSVINSCPTLCNPMDCAHRLLCPWDFTRQEYWSWLPFLTPGDLHSVGKTYSQLPRALICECTTDIHRQHTHTVLRSSPLLSQHIKMGPLNTLALGGFTHWAFLFFLFKIFFDADH